MIKNPLLPHIYKEGILMRISEFISLEGNPRREFKGKWGALIRSVSIIGTLVSIYLIATGVITAYQWYAIFLFFTILCLIRWSPFRTLTSSRLSLIVDIIFIIAGASACIFAILDYEHIIYRSVEPIKLDIIFGILLIISMLELGRRVNGIVLTFIALFSLFYAFAGPLFPGPFWHRGYSLGRLIGFQYLTLEGIFGVPTSICATIIIVFFLFGAFITWTKGGDFIIDVALGVAGRATGGPAKISTVSSALFGMVSGSAVANVVVDGVITIPLMKRQGFQPHVAAAVEAATSSGGQIMPPIMGAGAFIMASIIGVPYSTVMLAAIIPAFLYFFTIYWCVHFYAISRDLKPIPKEVPLPSVWGACKWGWVFFPPFGLLVYLIVTFYPIGISVILSTLLMTITTAILPRTRLNLKRTLNALEEAFTDMVPVAAACVCAGIIVGVIGLTGVGTKIGSMIVDLAGGNFFLTLVLCMIITLILGMGLPTTACYLVTASVTAPVLIQIGLSPLTAHLFVFVFSVFSGLTPPEALPAYTAAGIAGSEGQRTAVTSMLIGFSAYVTPFLFAYDNCFLAFGTGEFEAKDIITIGTSLLGFFVFPMGIMGAGLKGKFSVFERLLLLLGGFLLITLNEYLSLIGLIISAPIVFRDIRRNRKK